MHNVDNKYISPRIRGTYNLNRLLFDEPVPPRAASREQFTFAVHDLLDSMGFALYLTGYKFLAHVIELYLLQDDYTFAGAVKSTCDIYRAEEKWVVGNIRTSIEENRDFLIRAAKLLRRKVSVTENFTEDCIEILGAIFKRYFNYYLQ